MRPLHGLAQGKTGEGFVLLPMQMLLIKDLANEKGRRVRLCWYIRAAEHRGCLADEMIRSSSVHFPFGAY